MPVQQIYCTHCTYGTSALEQREGELADRVLGYSARAGSLDRAELRNDYRAIERFLYYYLPSDTPPEEKQRLDAASAPRRLFFCPAMGKLQMVGQVAYRQYDTAGRLGSYFAHVLFGDKESPWSAADCLRLWGAPWVEEDSQDVPFNLPALDGIDAVWAGKTPTIGDDAVLRFLQPATGADGDEAVITDRWRTAPAGQRIDLLVNTLQGLLALGVPRRESILLVVEPSVAALVFYAVARLLPKSLSEGLSFSTYEPNAERLSVTLAATVFFDPYTTDVRSDLYRRRGLVINTFQDRMSESGKPPGDYARFMVEKLLEEGWPTVDRLLAGFETAGAKRPEDLELLARTHPVVSQVLSATPPADDSWRRSEVAVRYLSQELQHQLATAPAGWPQLHRVIGTPNHLTVLELIASDQLPPKIQRPAQFLLKKFAPEKIADLVNSPLVARSAKVEALVSYITAQNRLPDGCQLLDGSARLKGRPTAEGSLLTDVLVKLPEPVLDRVSDSIGDGERMAFFGALLDACRAPTPSSSVKKVVLKMVSRFNDKPLLDALVKHREQIMRICPPPEPVLAKRLGRMLYELPDNPRSLSERLDRLRNWVGYFFEPIRAEDRIGRWGEGISVRRVGVEAALARLSKSAKDQNKKPRDIRPLAEALQHAMPTLAGSNLHELKRAASAGEVSVFDIETRVKAILRDDGVDLTTLEWRSPIGGEVQSVSSVGPPIAMRPPTADGTFHTPPTNATNDFLASAEQNFVASRYPDAMADVDRALTEQPSLRLRVLHAEVLFANAAFEPAATVMRGICKDFSPEKWHQLLAGFRRLYPRRESYERLLDKLEKEVMVRETPEKRFLLGIHYLRLGRAERSANELANVLRLNAQDDLSRSLLGVVKQVQKSQESFFQEAEERLCCYSDPTGDRKVRVLDSLCRVTFGDTGALTATERDFSLSFFQTGHWPVQRLPSTSRKKHSRRWTTSLAVVALAAAILPGVGYLLIGGRGSTTTAAHQSTKGFETTKKQVAQQRASAPKEHSTETPPGHDSSGREPKAVERQKIRTGSKKPSGPSEKAKNDLTNTPTRGPPNDKPSNPKSKNASPTAEMTQPSPDDVSKDDIAPPPEKPPADSKPPAGEKPSADGETHTSMPEKATPEEDTPATTTPDGAPPTMPHDEPSTAEKPSGDARTSADGTAVHIAEAHKLPVDPSTFWAQLTLKKWSTDFGSSSLALKGLDAANKQLDGKNRLVEAHSDGRLTIALERSTKPDSAPGTLAMFSTANNELLFQWADSGQVVGSVEAARRQLRRCVLQVDTDSTLPGIQTVTRYLSLVSPIRGEPFGLVNGVAKVELGTMKSAEFQFDEADELYLGRGYVELSDSSRVPFSERSQVTKTAALTRLPEDCLRSQAQVSLWTNMKTPLSVELRLTEDTQSLPDHLQPLSDDERKTLSTIKDRLKKLIPAIDKLQSWNQQPLVNAIDDHVQALGKVLRISPPSRGGEPPPPDPKEYKQQIRSQIIDRAKRRRDELDQRQQAIVAFGKQQHEDFTKLKSRAVKISTTIYRRVDVDIFAPCLMLGDPGHLPVEFLPPYGNED